MRRIPGLSTLCSLCLLLLVFSAPAFAAEVRLSVAASLTDVVRELSASYAAANPGTTFFPNFGSSGAMARQIAHGAPADIFISAHEKWMEYLVQERLISSGTVRNFAGNSLVFVAAGELRGASLREMPALRRIAIGSPRSVPAGEYAKQALENAEVWGELAAGGKLVMAEDVRQALVYADRGEVDGAFVYRTDALLARGSKILFEICADLHDPITYPMGLTVRGARNPAAVAFFDYLGTSEAKEILEKYGFAVN